MPKVSCKTDKTKEKEEEYEIVAFEEFCDRSERAPSDPLTANDNINYRLCYEKDKPVNQIASGSKEDIVVTKGSRNFAPFGRTGGKEKCSVFSGVIPKTAETVIGQENHGDHGYQRFSDHRNIFRRAWDSLPSVSSTLIAMAILIALFVGVWWLICGTLGTSWEEHHYKKLLEHTHPEKVHDNVAVTIPVEVKPTRVPENRYHDHNNLSTKNKYNKYDGDAKKELLKRKLTSEQNATCDNVPMELRVDCWPGSPVTKQKCEARGCCWRTTDRKGPPYCFYSPKHTSYRLLNETENSHGMKVIYERLRPSGYPGDWELAAVDFVYVTPTILRIKMYDPSNRRFEVPIPQPPIPMAEKHNIQYKVSVDRTCGFKVFRKGDDTPIMNTQNMGTWILSSQLLQVTTRLPNETSVVGFGEHRARLQRDMDWKTWTMFNRDTVPADNTNLYGTQPFYMGVEKNGSSHGLLLVNSNAMDVVLQPTPAITYRTIGGVLDFYLMIGPTPQEVSTQLTYVTGRPFLPPYWSLGFHICKYGYKDVNYTREVWKRNRDAEIPFDVQWNDIDYMKNNNDFTIDANRYSGLDKFVKELHSVGMHYMMIIDPGVSASEPAGSYPPFDLGITMDVFVKNKTNQPFVAKVWNPVSTVYPDFSHPNATPYWSELMSRFHARVPYDGAWIDMNEPSNFLNGEALVGCQTDKLPYRPAFVPESTGLQTKTLCPDAKHYIGSHYDVHNLYALYEAIATNFALKEIRGRRAFIISRASFPGLGAVAGHWTGDIQSTWDDLRMTIPAILQFSLFGIPMVGSDICGFGGRTDPDLCKRWTQLGAFYPFSRNHGDNHQPDHDPAVFGTEMALVAREFYRMRYRLLPYLYTLFWRAHQDGTLVARPLFVEYPGNASLIPVDTQFFLGPHVIISPILHPNVTFERHYFPEPYKYYRFSNGQGFNSGHFDVTDDEIVAVRSGAILVLQNPPPHGPTSTSDCRRRSMQILAAPSHNNTKESLGELYWDDGDGLNNFAEKKYTLIEFRLVNGELSSVVNWWGYGVPLVDNITILGLEPIRNVLLNERPIKFSYANDTKKLNVNVNITLDKPFSLKWYFESETENEAPLDDCTESQCETTSFLKISKRDP